MHTRSVFTGLAAVLLVVLAAAGLALAQDNGQAFIGIRFEQLENGALIGEVLAGSPADEAGLLPGDLITAFDGTPVSLDSPLIPLVDARAPGDTVSITVDRAGEILELELTLTSRPDDLDSAPAAGDEAAPEAELRPHILVAGVTLMDLGSRWHVTAVEPGSAADDAGLRLGDIITHVDGRTIDTYDTGLLATRAADGGDLTLTVERAGEVLDLVLTLEAGTAVETHIQPGVIPHSMPSEPQARPPATSPQMAEAKGFLGVSYIMLDGETLQMLEETEGLPFEMPAVSEGALVIEVVPDTPAAEAGLVPGDVITKVDGDVVDVERTLSDRIYAYEAGDTVTLEMVRGVDVLEISITLAARPEETGMAGVLPPGMMQPFDLFTDPSFDLDGFLEAYPDLLDDLRENGLDSLLPGLSQMFSDPQFDWQRFLADHPGFAELLGRLAEVLNPDELEELFPNFPWFSQQDPFHGELDPLLPNESDNSSL